MRRYLLDTPVLAAALLGRAGATALLTPWITRGEAATSILVYGEVLEYIRGRTDFPQLRLQLRELLEEINPHFLTYAIMQRYADIRLQLRPQGQLIGDIDTLIAATALERNLTLVTIDPDFQRVPGLKVHLLTRQQLVRR
jgi:predicted nucleic acid-binding protein